MIKTQKQEEKDDYQTPLEALIPLLPHLNKDWVIWECASGRGSCFTKHLEIGKQLNFYNIVK